MPANSSRRLVACAMLVAAAAAACSSDPASTARGPQPTIAPSKTPAATCTSQRPRRSTVQYARYPATPATLNSLDIYAPEHARCAPVFLFVHGGLYCCGDKSKDIPSTTDWFNAHGYMVVSINYRLTRGPGRVAYPKFLNDVAAAVHWVHKNIGLWGGDPNRIVLAGHSTGGEMAAVIATDERYLQRAGLDLTALRCVAVLDSFALDLPRFVVAARTPEPWEAIFGRTTAQLRDESAAAHIAPGKHIPPFLIVERLSHPNPFVPLQQHFTAALRAAGVAVTVVDPGTIGHGAVITNIGRPDDRTMTVPMLKFLSECSV